MAGGLVAGDDQQQRELVELFVGERCLIVGCDERQEIGAGIRAFVVDVGGEVGVPGLRRRRTFRR